MVQPQQQQQQQSKSAAREAEERPGTTACFLQYHFGLDVEIEHQRIGRNTTYFEEE